MSSLPADRYDFLIIGGGINGAGIARDAAGRGFRVFLCERGDLASGTSSASTKLIHGGLRYLEYYEFRLVREALGEREMLLRAAPHIIWPLRFVLPHDASMRPRWMIRLGLFLYDHLGKRQTLPGCEAIALSEHPAGKPLKADYRHAYAYSDCWVEDARLVALNALDAAERGAEIRTGTALVEAKRTKEGWIATLEAQESGKRFQVAAKVLVNAAGPRVKALLDEELAIPTRKSLRLSKGSHIVVPKLYDGDHAYIIQNPDRRIVFMIPYERDFTLIGTTDVDYQGTLQEITISEEEKRYLIDSVARYLTAPPGLEDIVWSYAGVRPLFEDMSASDKKDVAAVTRDYSFDIDKEEPGAPVLSIFGGKITTYRKLSEHATSMLSELLGKPTLAWTAGVALPGGDVPGGDFAAYSKLFQKTYPWLPEALARRYLRAYGTRTEALLGRAQALADLGDNLGEEGEKAVYEAELTYVREQEFARSGEDFLWRRSKLGLHLSSAATKRVLAWFQSDRQAPAAPKKKAAPRKAVKNMQETA